jgi:hypothetical protein
MANATSLQDRPSVDNSHFLDKRPVQDEN